MRILIVADEVLVGIAIGTVVVAVLTVEVGARVWMARWVVGSVRTVVYVVVGDDQGRR